MILPLDQTPAGKREMDSIVEPELVWLGAVPINQPGNRPAISSDKHVRSPQVAMDPVRRHGPTAHAGRRRRADPVDRCVVGGHPRNRRGPMLDPSTDLVVADHHLM